VTVLIAAYANAKCTPVGNQQGGLNLEWHGYNSPLSSVPAMNSGTLIKEDHSPVIDLNWGGGMGQRSGRNDRVGVRWSGYVQLE
jgi:hypothetical protein